MIWGLVFLWDKSTNHNQKFVIFIFLYLLIIIIVFNLILNYNVKQFCNIILE